jgi:putative endonuclease
MRVLPRLRVIDRRMRHAARKTLQGARGQLRQVWMKWRLRRPYPIQECDEPIGKYGERLASVFLERCGYAILELSFRTRLGEIDIIAVWERKQVVFVEVKTWAGEWINAGGPSDAVDEAKQKKITQTALVYLKRHSLLETPARMDVIEVVFDSSTRKPIFRHFENAFEAIGEYQMFS